MLINPFHLVYLKYAARLAFGDLIKCVVKVSSLEWAVTKCVGGMFTSPSSAKVRPV